MDLSFFFFGQDLLKKVFILLKIIIIIGAWKRRQPSVKRRENHDGGEGASCRRLCDRNSILFTAFRTSIRLLAFKSFTDVSAGVI